MDELVLRSPVVRTLLSFAMLLLVGAALVPARAAAQSGQIEDLTKRYWFDAKAAWKLNAAGQPTGVIVTGRTNLPKQTRMRVWVAGGEYGHVHVSDGGAEVGAPKQVETISVTTPLRGVSAPGVLWPIIVPEAVAEFTIETRAAPDGMIVPGAYKVQVVCESRQRPMIRNLIYNELQQTERSLSLDWGAPETLEMYSAKIRRLFAEDIQALEKIVNDTGAQYHQMVAGKESMFELARFLDSAEKQTLDLAMKSRTEVQPSDVCYVTKEYLQVVEGFARQAILPMFDAIRKEIESRVNHIQFIAPALAYPNEQLELITTYFNSIYDNYQLLRAGTAETLPEVQKLIGFFRQLPGLLADYRQNNDAEGFAAFIATVNADLPVQLANISSHLPTAESKDLFLETVRGFYADLVSLQFSDLDAAAIHRFQDSVKNLEDIAKMLAAALGEGAGK